MLTKHQNSNFPFFKILLTAFLVAAAIVIFAMSLASCNSSKHISKTKDTTNEVVKVDSTEHYKEMLEQLRLQYEEEKQDLKAKIGFEQRDASYLLYEFNKLQELYNTKGLSFDSLNTRLREIFDSIAKAPCKSSVKVDSKGTIEATGVKSFDFEALIANTRMELYKDSLQKERDLRVKAEKELHNTSQVQTKEKKKGGGFGIGFAVASVMWVGLFILLLWWAVKRAEKDDTLEK